MLALRLLLMRRATAVRCHIPRAKIAPSRAVATSGGAVFFAGATVTIALLSLLVANIPQVTAMGEMAAISVVVAVLAALTLLPAVLGLLGPRVDALRVRPRYSEEKARAGGWAKWAAAIARQPAWSGLLALAILIPLTIPLFSLNLGQQDNAAMSESTTIRQAYDLTTKYFGPGTNGPLLIAAKLGSPAESTGDSRLATLQKDVSSTSGVVPWPPSTAPLTSAPAPSPLFASAASTCSSRRVASGSSPASTSASRMIPLSVSVTTLALCPSKTLLLLLRPCRTSGSCAAASGPARQVATTLPSSRGRLFTRKPRSFRGPHPKHVPFGA